MLSIVIPVYNEQDNIFPLRGRLSAALQQTGEDYEVIIVNDGSSDQTEAKLKVVAAKDAGFKIVNFRRNFGQTAAMMAGIDFASGDIIVGLDGDLQNDPADTRSCWPSWPKAMTWFPNPPNLSLTPCRRQTDAA